MKKSKRIFKNIKCEYTFNLFKSIEMETKIEFDWSTFLYIDKFVNSENIPVPTTSINILSAKLIYLVITYSPRKCCEILSAEIRYGIDGEQEDALKVREQIKSYVPNVEITIRDIFKYKPIKIKNYENRFNY